MVSRTVREQSAKRQREYKARLRSEGGGSISVALQRGIPAKLDALAAEHGVSRQAIINALIHSPPKADRIAGALIAVMEGDEDA